MTGNGVLKAFSLDGDELWARDLQKDYGRFGLQWGYGSSPLLEGDTLYVQVLHGTHTREPSYLLGIDAATGKNRFRVERPTPAIQESPDAYTTPAVARRGKARGDRGHRGRRRHRPRSGRPAASCGAQRASTRTTRATTAWWLRRWRWATSWWRRRACARCSRCAPSAAAT